MTYCWLGIDENGSWHKFSRLRLAEEGMEAIIVIANFEILQRAVIFDSMLKAI